MSEKKTPLNSVRLTASSSNLLRSMWIENTEEFLASMVALKYGAGKEEAEDVMGQLGVSLSEIGNKIDLTIREKLNEPFTDWSLGCQVPAEAENDYKKFGRIRPRKTQPKSAFIDSYPNSVRLFDKFYPIRNQGSRGTCVAFGTVAFREFLYGFTKEFSEQFFYWACKEIDGSPGPGTYISTAQTVLDEYGVCERSIWPYNSYQESDEGQGPPPDGTLSDAQDHRLRATRNVEPDLIAQYKSVLANDNMPITFGTLVHSSWLNSSETARTGKITMPYPDEYYAGAHAWCVVGYVDNTSVPGGGYLIVRNSWGTSWASESPEAPGHAMMPYAYAEKYVIQAFTGPGNAINDGNRIDSNNGRNIYIWKLKKPQREHNTEKRLRSGTEVIGDPKHPYAVMENRGDRWDEFVSKGYHWNIGKAGQKGDASRLQFADPQGLKESISSCADFIDSLRRNVKDMKGLYVPNQILSFWQRISLQNYSVKSYNLNGVNLKDQLIDASFQDAYPKYEYWPEQITRDIERITSCEVYRLSAKGIMIHVISAYFDPLKKITDELQPLKFSRNHIDHIRKVYNQWLKKYTTSEPDLILFSIGTSRAIEGNLSLVKSDSSFTIVSQCKDEEWHTNEPSGFEECNYMRQLVALLKPVTKEEIKKEVKVSVDKRLMYDDDSGGLPYVSNIAEETGFSKTQVREAFLSLQRDDESDYSLYWENIPNYKGKELAIEMDHRESSAPIRASDFRRSWFGRNFTTILLPSISCILGIILMAVNLNLSLAAFFTSIPLTFIGSWISKAINAKLDPEN